MRMALLARAALGPAAVVEVVALDARGKTLAGSAVVAVS
jgi:hypothetical protein